MLLSKIRENPEKIKNKKLSICKDNRKQSL